MEHSISHYIAQRLPSNNRFERIWKIAQVDFRSRYYNDRLGLLWALIKPVFEACVYYVVFTIFFNITIEDYAIYLFGGIVVWMAFSEASSKGMHLLQHKFYLIDNIQFNLIDIYVGHVFTVFFGFGFNMAAFVLISLIFGHSFTFLFLPAIVVLISLYLLCLAASLILSSFQPFVKDLIHLWDMLLLAGFWTSGILFDAKDIFAKALWYAYANPMIGIIQNTRACFSSNLQVDYFWLYYNLAYTIVLVIIGLFIFKKFGSLAIEKI